MTSKRSILNKNDSKPSSDYGVNTEFQNLILESINDVIGISSKDKGIIYVSPSVTNETGWSAQDMTSKNVFHLAHEDDIPIIHAAFKRLDLEEQVVFEWRSKTKSGRYGWVETTVKNACNPTDNEVYRVFSCRNIQLRKEIQEQLIKTTEELTNLNRMKDKFFSLIAHDLKNPMFSLITLTEFIRQQLPVLSQSDYLEFVNQINDAAKNSFALLENLLEWAQSQTNTIEFNPELVNIEQIIQETWKLTKSQALNKNIGYHFDIQPELYAVVDYKMLSTIIRNLVSNSVKYTPDNGRIFITACIKNNRLLITVEDTGIGMSKEQIHYLFTFDAKKHLNGVPAKHGSGLGLVLCKEFTEKHGGSIEVQSRIGVGSTIILSIPQPDR